ncbi:cupin domain-containing protein [Planctomycetota bacterium]
MKITKTSNVEKSAVRIDGAEGVRIQWLISKEDGAQNFAMRMFEVQPGGYTPLHIHSHEHEVFIIEGRGIFICEGAEHEFGPEYVIFVPPNKEHRFKNTGETLLRFLCLIPASAV